MRLKKIMGITLAALMMTGSLAGCSGGGVTNATAASQGGETTAQTETKQSETNPLEKTVINVWSKDRHDATYAQAKVDEYNANNTDNIQINYQLYTDNYVQAIDMAVQSGELPDILVQQEQMFDKYVNEGQWANLYDYMDEDMKTYFKSVIFPGYNEFDGKLYFIPTTGTTCRLFYNKEIFERVGIKEPPKTLEEVVEGEDMYKTCESIYYGDADIESTLKDLTERYNKAYQEAIKNGTGREIKIANYDPMNPSLQ